MLALADTFPRPSGPKPIVLIAGPTATGKSALALAVAMREGGIIINADSMQIYDALPVLTARPSAKELAAAPHALYAALHPADECSAARWVQLAERAIVAAWHAGQLPIVVGGTGLYFKALIDGLSDIPAIAPEVRVQVRSLLEQEGTEAVKAALAPLDPRLAAKLDDGQRLARALEVARSTGRPLSEWQADRPAPGLLAQDGVEMGRYVLLDERAAIYARCNGRLDQMVGQGILEEVDAFRKDATLHPSPLQKCVGYPPLKAHLEGDLSLDDALEVAKRDTRRYAKRQLTWMRNQFGKWNTLFVK